MGLFGAEPFPFGGFFVFKVFQPLSPALASNYCGIYVTHYCAVTPGKAARGPRWDIKDREGVSGGQKVSWKGEKKKLSFFLF